MINAAMKKIDDSQAEKNRKAYATSYDAAPLYVSVRTRLAACPAIDMSAAKKTAELLHVTIEELDGACG